MDCNVLAMIKKREPTLLDQQLKKLGRGNCSKEEGIAWLQGGDRWSGLGTLIFTYPINWIRWSESYCMRPYIYITREYAPRYFDSQEDIDIWGSFFVRTDASSNGGGKLGGGCPFGENRSPPRVYKWKSPNVALNMHYSAWAVHPYASANSAALRSGNYDEKSRRALAFRGTFSASSTENRATFGCSRVGCYFLAVNVSLPPPFPM